MEELMAALDRAFTDYRRELEECQRKSKPTDGLLGFGHSIKDDACHERFDERLKAAVDALCAAKPSPGEARRAAERLLSPRDGQDWPLSAQWMLRAAERHALTLIPYLSREDAEAFFLAYKERYRPWDRLPAQKSVFRALKERAGKG